MGALDILTEALQLKPQEKYLVIENLLLSLDCPDKEIEDLWIKESLARLEAYNKGTLKTLSYDDVFKC
ncbi:MAG: addiction module protein [Sulfuricurvum sp.]